MVTFPGVTDEFYSLIHTTRLHLIILHAYKYRRMNASANFIFNKIMSGNYWSSNVTLLSDFKNKSVQLFSDVVSMVFHLIYAAF